MKQVSYFIVFVLFYAFIKPLSAQKKPIDLTSLDQWEWFTERKISNDGRWITFGTAPVNSRKSVLRLKDMHSGQMIFFSEAYNGRFSGDSRSFTCQLSASKAGMPDTTIVMQLSNGSVQKLPSITAFNWPDSTSTICSWLTGQKGEQALTITIEREERLLTLKNVQQHLLLPKGEGVYYSVKDSDGVSLLYTSFLQRKTDTLLKNKVGIGAFSLDATGERIAFPVTDHQKTALFLYESKEKRLKQLFIKSELNDTGYVVNAQTKVQFVKDSQLLFSTQYVYPERINPPLTGEACVEVWSTSDRQIYTKQKRELQTTLNKPYYFSYDLPTGKQLQLTTLDVDEWQFPEMRTTEYVLVSTSLPYQSQTQWDPVVRRDVYLINMKTGEKKQVAKNTAAIFKFSPYGQYILWFDRDRQHYYTYAAKTGAIRKIDKGITDQLADRSLGLPQAPESFGVALWEEHDRSLLITTNRNVWKVDPSGQLLAQNLTALTVNTKGLQFSFYGHWRQVPYYTNTDTLLFYAIEDKTKDAGFFAVTPGVRQVPSKLLFGKYSFVFPGMAIAGNGRQTILSFGNNNFYGLFYSKDLQHFDTLYVLNPKQKGYNWYKTELVRWQVRKGQYTEGVLYKPENFDPTKKYPLIVWMYENGHSKNIHDYVLPQWSASFVNFAFYASNGYVIFVPDIRYQIGKPGVSAYETVMTGIDYLQKQSWLDTSRMGLQGHSWGGYEVAYMLTRTDRFKAASAGAVVANMTSAYGGIRPNYNGESRQWVYEKHQSRLGASLWQQPELYLENSPLFKAHKITTPLLLVHNEQDGGVPFAQSIEFFSALKRLNKKAWLLNYPAENHVLRNPVNKRDFTYRLFQYFEHYLKDKLAPTWMTDGIPAVKEGYIRGY